MCLTTTQAIVTEVSRIISVFFRLWIPKCWLEEVIALFIASSTNFFLAKFWKNKKREIKWFWNWGEKAKCSRFLYLFFRRLIKKMLHIWFMQPDLAICSQSWSPLFLHLHSWLPLLWLCENSHKKYQLETAKIQIENDLWRSHK